MLVFLTLCYVGIVWLIFFKLRLLPWNRASQGVVGLIGAAALVAIVVAMNLYQPYSTDVRVYNLVVEVVPRVTGRVVDVPVAGGEPVKQGDVLFEIDPRPFEYEVKRLEASLAMARANADIAQQEFDRNTKARRTGAVAERDVDLARARLEAGTGEVGSLEAQLSQARYDLDQATERAPLDGRVIEMTLRPGQIATSFVVRPVATFVSDEAPKVVATYPPNALRHIAIGDEVEVAFDRHPGEIFPGRVVRLGRLSGEGQLKPDGNVSTWAPIPASRYPIIVALDADPGTLDLPGGAGGASAVYTDRAKPIRIIRRVMIRMYSWLNYFFL